MATVLAVSAEVLLAMIAMSVLPIEDPVNTVAVLDMIAETLAIDNRPGVVIDVLTMQWP